MQTTPLSNKKTVATLVPLNLRRVPEQPYLGKIVDSNPNGRHIFATPHGLLIEVGSAQLSEPTADQYREIMELEDAATLDKKILYGGTDGLREFKKTLSA